MHMFWTCAPLGQFWNALLSYIDRIYVTKVPRTPLVCVLGLVEDSLGDEYFKLTLQRLLYQARKLQLVG